METSCQTRWFNLVSRFEPSWELRSMAESGALWTEVPEFKPMVGCSQNKYHAYDVWEHTLKVLDACPVEDPILRLAALFHDIGKPASKMIHLQTGEGTFYDHEVIGANMTEAILSRLEFSDECRNQIVHLVRHHFIRYERNWTNSAVRRWVRLVGLENITPLCSLARADIVGKGTASIELDLSLISELESRAAEIQITKSLPVSKVLAVSGKDVMDHLGIPSGPLVGKVLSHLLEAVASNLEDNTRERLLEIASNFKVSEIC